MDTTEVGRYVALRRRVKELEAQAAGVKEEADALEQRLLEEFALESVDRITVDGMTVYLRTQRFAALAEGASKDALMDALDGHPHSRGLVNRGFNWNSVNSFVRELVGTDGDDPLPEYLRGLVRVTETHRLRTVKSG